MFSSLFAHLRRLARDWFLIGMLTAVLLASLFPDAGKSGGWLHMENVVDIGVALVFFLLRFTMFGRGIYAIGGSEVSAHRAGFNVIRTKVIMYVLVGMIASLAGIIRASMMQQAHPTNMLGMEMNIIAGVVRGGTAITGGRGTLTGCMLGTLLIVIVENSMILLGIPTSWRSVFTGVLIIVGTGVSAYQTIVMNRSKRVQKAEKGVAA